MTYEERIYQEGIEEGLDRAATQYEPPESLCRAHEREIAEAEACGYNRAIEEVLALPEFEEYVPPGQEHLEARAATNAANSVRSEIEEAIERLRRTRGYCCEGCGEFFDDDNGGSHACRTGEDTFEQCGPITLMGVQP